MSPYTALLGFSGAVVLVVALGCSDSDDDGCIGCMPSMGGSVRFPPTAPTSQGPEPNGGTMSGGGASGSATGGFGGTVTGGVGGTVLGGTGGVGANGGAEGGTSNGGTLGAGGTLNGGVGGAF